MKYFYIEVLKYKTKIEWLGESRYRLTCYHENGNKCWEKEYKSDRQHGKHGNGDWMAYYWEGKWVSEQEYLAHLKIVMGKTVEINDKIVP